MQNGLSGEQCVLCGTTAAVRVSGTSFCAPCGLQRHHTVDAATLVPQRGRSRRRVALFGALTSGLLFKFVAGAVAVAAVGGVAATTLMQPDAPQLLSATTQAVVAPVDSTVATDDDPIPATLGFAGSDTSQRTAAEAYGAAIQEWATCVAEAALAHTGESFDPLAACPPQPSPQDHGFPASDAPGHDPEGPGNSEDAPGQTGEGPGNSGDAPGHDPEGPGNSEDAPGQNKPPKEDKDK